MTKDKHDRLPIVERRVDESLGNTRWIHGLGGGMGKIVQFTPSVWPGRLTTTQSFSDHES